jgi:hypothetical protein
MDSTKNILPKKTVRFFKDLSEYIDKKILYFGSVQRTDYFSGYSDIDVDIFTDNVESTLTKIQHFLNIKRSKFKKIAWQLNSTKRVVYGYKIMYENPGLNLLVEFSIYNDKYKKGILEEHLKKMVLPFYISFALYILKFLYYYLHLIPRQSYSYIKNKLLTNGLGLPDEHFVAF